MVKRVNQGEGRGAVEGSSVIESCGDMNRRLIDIGNTEVDFSHTVRVLSNVFGLGINRMAIAAMEEEVLY